MTRSHRIVAGHMFAFALVLGGCGDDGTDNQTAETIEDIADDARAAANDAWASFRTNFERLVDEAATDNEAKEELLDNCRDTLQQLREANDPDADRLEEVCDQIRDADEQADWDELRPKLDEIGEGR